MDEITPLELKQRLDRGETPVLLDVRQDWEREICRLEGSIQIPIEEIQWRIGELKPEDEIVVYCHHGIRSAAVARFLLERGFPRVANLRGGISLWASWIDPTMPRY